jgi:hypothetical protein
MDDVQQVASTANEFLQAAIHELTSVRLLIQLALIVVAAGIAGRLSGKAEFLSA